MVLFIKVIFLLRQKYGSNDIVYDKDVIVASWELRVRISWDEHQFVHNDIIAIKIPGKFDSAFVSYVQFKVSPDPTMTETVFPL